MTTRALLHSLLVCHLPLSTTWLVCFLSLIYFFLHGTSFKKQILELLLCTHLHKHKICSNYTNQRTHVGGRKHHIYITLHTHMGVTSFGQSSLKWFWWCRYLKHDATLCAMQHILVSCSDIVKALAEVEFEVIFREVFEVNSSRSVLHASRTDCSSVYP